MSNSRLKRLEKVLMQTDFKPLITMTDDNGKLVHWKTLEPVTREDLDRADLHIQCLWE